MNELIEALKNGTFRLDCPEMELIQEGTATPDLFKGPGYLGQEPAGTIVFKLFSARTEPLHEFLDPYKDLIPGQLLPETQYYTLHAVDSHGRKWTAGRIMPDFNYCQQAVFASGTLRHIEHVQIEGAKTSSARFEILFFEEISLPYNQGTVTEKRVANNLVSRSFRRNVASFSTAGLRCRITLDDGMTTLTAKTKGQLPPNIDVRVIETFQFILARTVWPRVIQICAGGSNVIRFTSALGPSGKPLMSRPIEANTLEELVWTWELFNRYFSYILLFRGEGWHQCSRHLHAVSKASIQSVHSEGLALSVAVEGVCNDVFGHLCKPTNAFKATVKSLQRHADKWTGQGAGEDVEAVRKRLPGLIGMLTTPRAIDRMYFLAERGWIDKELVAAWQKLRNRLAHGSTPEVRVPQDFLDLCQQVTDLLYQLVFSAIGYKGKYIIRRPKAWQPCDFPSHEFWSSRLEAIKLTAYYRWLNRGASHGGHVEDWLTAESEVFDAEWQKVKATGENQQPQD